MMERNFLKRKIKSSERGYNLSKDPRAARANCAGIWRKSVSGRRQSNCIDHEMEQVLGALKEQQGDQVAEAGDTRARPGGEGRMKEICWYLNPPTGAFTSL